MDELPRVRALLAELLHLDEADYQLPPRVLVNLHRGLLRKPLEMVALYAASNRGWTETSEKRWPQVADAHYGADAKSLAAYRRAESAHGGDMSQYLPSDLGEGPTQLSEDSFEGWQTYDPLVVLSMLTWPHVELSSLMALLDAELAAVPHTHQMLVELANLEHAEVMAESW